MEVSIEQIIVRIVQEVVRELKARNVTVVYGGSTPVSGVQGRSRSETIDMSAYKTPVLTENRLQRLHELTGEVIVPEGTIVTPKARELIRRKNLKIVTINGGQ
ncbi:hypothetical protein JW948_16190 [bacterium]|nr:hypothetical protein [bacterium]